MQACEEVTSSYNLIESLFAELGEFTVRLQEYAKLPIGQSMKKKVVATLAW
jgi:hypothetical protein